MKLGLDGVIDPGYQIIFPAEPSQGFAVSSAAIEHDWLPFVFALDATEHRKHSNQETEAKFRMFRPSGFIDVPVSELFHPT